MEFVNKTPLAAELFIGEIENPEIRIGIVVAKATFRILPDGNTEPDTDNPYPISPSDEKTPLGLLPRDDFPKNDCLDVILLGKAYAPGGQSDHMSVTLEIGDATRSLEVFGDRKWDGGSISSPEPFETMPLTYANAFGGKAEVEIDEGSFVTVSDPRNQNGKGFNPGPIAKAIGDELKSPPGYPRVFDDCALPNIEDPEQLIKSRDDKPDPACWATLPLTSAIHAQRAMRVDKEQMKKNDPKDKGVWAKPGLYYRAHPSLVLCSELEASTTIRLFGVTPEGEMNFQAPSWEVNAEFLLGNRHAEKILRPDTLVILPEERRFYIVYRLMFNFEFESEVQRCVRLKVSAPA